MPRIDIVHPGHDDLPDVPLGTRDSEWMRGVARLDLLVLTRDRRIRTTPAELALYRELGIRAVWLGAKRDLGPQDQVEVFLRHEDRLNREIVKRGPGPWAVTMSPSGIRPIRLEA